MNILLSLCLVMTFWSISRLISKSVYRGNKTEINKIGIIISFGLDILTAILWGMYFK